MINQRLQIVIDAENKAAGALKQVEGQLGGVQERIQTMQGKLERFDPAFKTMAIGGTAAFAAIAGVIGLSVSKAAEFEQMQISFETMLGSAEKGTKMLKDLIAFAAKTPFEVKGIQDTARQLLAYGFTQEEVMSNLKIMGDLAAGVGMDRLPLITLAFGQVKAATKLTGMELRQFTENGIPLLAALSEQMGVSVGTIQQMVSEGKIGFEDVRKALESMTIEGGRFANLMERQSTTLAGRWSTFKDTLAVTATTIGTALLPYAQKLLEVMIPIVTKIGEWVAAHPKLTAAILAAAAALAGLVAVVGIIGVAVVGFMGMLAAAGLTIGGFVVVLGTIAAVSGGVIIAIGLIGGAAAALAYVIVTNWDKIKATTIAVWDSIKAYLHEVWEDIKSSAAAALDWILSKIEKVMSAYNKVKSAVSSVVSAGKSVVGARAAGGPVSAGAPYIVGERGPETFVPATAGRIIRSGSGGTTININIGGNTFMGKEGIAREIGDELMHQLNLRSKFAS
jgi:tape measure domain-containing protein